MADWGLYLCHWDAGTRPFPLADLHPPLALFVPDGHSAKMEQTSEEDDDDDVGGEHAVILRQRSELARPAGHPTYRPPVPAAAAAAVYRSSVSLTSFPPSCSSARSLHITPTHPPRAMPSDSPMP